LVAPEEGSKVSVVEDLRRHLKEECAEIEAVLRREQYVHRTLFAEGANPYFETFRRSMMRKKTDNVSVYADEDLFMPRRMILLGGTGSGKSFVIKRGFVGAASRFETGGPAPFLLDLDAHLGTQLELVEAIDTKYDGMFSKALSEYKPGCYLMLDSLDDRLLRTNRRFPNDLRAVLQRCSLHLAGCIIACRRAAFDPEWFRNSPLGLEVFHVDHLGAEEFGEILPEDVKRREFFVECERLGISDLLSVPFDGFYLARRFAAGKSLPNTRRECLESRIDEMLLGTEEDRKHEIDPPAIRLRTLARHLACLATFTECGIWTQKSALDSLSESLAVCNAEPVHPDEVRALFGRPLFVRAGLGFGFVHQLYREFLAAESLRAVPLRKQKQLLGTALPGSRRICTPYRGVAAFVAEKSEEYFDELIEDDPLVALFAESPSLRPEQEKKLLTHVFALAVRNQLFPWWMVPPRGDQPVNELSKHRFSDPSGFLRDYLLGSDSTARMWASACAARWGGVATLNGVLVALALDPTEHEETRKWALEAVKKSGDRAAMTRLYSLTSDPHDSVRGDALEMFRNSERPSPSEFVRRLRGGATEKNLSCSLQLEARRFGLELSWEQLREAFSAVRSELDGLKDLAGYVLGGLFERAGDLGFADVPAELVFRCMCGGGSLVRVSEPSLASLVNGRDDVIKRVWELCLERFRLGDQMAFTARWKIVEWAGDRLLKFLRTELTANAEEKRFVEVTLRSLFNNGTERTPDRFAQFQAVAPSLVDDSWLPVPIAPSAIVDPQGVEQSVLDALAVDGGAIERTWLVIRALRKVTRIEGPGQTVEKIIHVIDQLPESTRESVLGAFRECTARVIFETRRKGRNVSSTKADFVIPFWVLRRRGEAFQTSKIAEIAACYAYEISQKEEIGRWDSLMGELRDKDVAVWRRCLLTLIEHGSEQAKNALRLLGAESDGCFIDLSRKQMCSGQLPPVRFEELVDYWRLIRPNDYQGVLHACYRSLCEPQISAANLGTVDEQETEAFRQALVGPHPWFVALLLLMADGSDLAWQDFETHVRAGTIPRQFDFERLGLLAPSLSRTRLTTVADWLIMEFARDSEAEMIYGASQGLLKLIAESEVTEAFEELRRVRANVDPTKQVILSATMLQIEDRAIGQIPPRPSGAELLNFINLPRLAIVRDERDLFEAVCQAIEDIQFELEKRGEGVAGFWDGSRPKTEPDCQNVLWPRLRDKLFQFGVSGVEERCVGPNRVDFWVELARAGREPLTVAVELKTARKGLGRSWLVDTIGKQLWEKYLRPTRCRHGIHIVLWFRDHDRYDSPSQWKTAKVLSNEVRHRCNQLEREHGISLAGYVMDLTSRHRDR
jgi:hypothetical protein